MALCVHGYSLTKCHKARVAGNSKVLAPSVFKPGEVPPNVSKAARSVTPAPTVSSVSGVTPESLVACEIQRPRKVSLLSPSTDHPGFAVRAALRVVKATAFTSPGTPETVRHKERSNQ